MDGHIKEREIIQNYHNNKEKAVLTLENAIFAAESTIKTLSNELLEGQSIIKRFRKVVDNLSTEMSKSKTDLTTKKLKKIKLEKQRIEKEGKIKEIEKGIVETQNALKQQKVEFTLSLAPSLGVLGG